MLTSARRMLAAALHRIADTIGPTPPRWPHSYCLPPDVAARLVAANRTGRH